MNFLVKPVFRSFTRNSEVCPWREAFSEGVPEVSVYPILSTMPEATATKAFILNGDYRDGKFSEPAAHLHHTLTPDAHSATARASTNVRLAESANPATSGG
jgi:hypothetical protein